MGANPNGISSSGQSCPDRFKLDQPPVTVSPGRRRTASNCNPNCNPVLWRDPLLRRSVCAAGQPAHPQVSGCMGLSVSDRDFPALTGRSGTQRARRQWSAATASTLAPWCSSSSGELRITRVFSCVAHRFKARPSFMFAGCCWWRSLVIDGSSGTRVRSAVARARRLRPCTTAMVSPAR